MFGKAVAVLGLIVVIAAVSPALAQTPEPVRSEVGVLTCKVAPVTGEQQEAHELECSFEPVNNRPPSTYEGRIAPLMEEIAAASPTVMTWQVLSAAPDVDVGALAGVYRGVVQPEGQGGDVTTYLIGGVDEAITLIPLSVSADQGANMAGAVAELELKTVKA